MAVLIAPTVAYAYVNDRGKPKKFHLEVSWSTAEDRMSVCGLYIPDGTHYRAQGIEEKIENLQPDQICKRCLGAMKIV